MSQRLPISATDADGGRQVCGSQPTFTKYAIEELQIAREPIDYAQQDVQHAVTRVRPNSEYGLPDVFYSPTSTAALYHIPGYSSNGGDPWADSEIDPQEMLLVAGNSKYSTLNMNVDRSITPFESPESNSTSSTDVTDTSDSVNLDIQLEYIFDENLMPFGPHERDSLELAGLDFGMSGGNEEDDQSMMRFDKRFESGTALSSTDLNTDKPSQVPCTIIHRKISCSDGGEGKLSKTYNVAELASKGDSNSRDPEAPLQSTGNDQWKDVHTINHASCVTSEVSSSTSLRDECNFRINPRQYHKPQETSLPSPNSDVTVYSDPSAGFETDSTCSEEDIDWQEDTKNYDHSTLLDILHADLPLTINSETKEPLIVPILTPMKQGLVDTIMAEFWNIFNQEWTSTLRKCAGPPVTTSLYSDLPTSSSKPSSESRNLKRPREDDDNQSSDENDRRDPKRPKKASSSPELAANLAKFACPYRKHDPRKYCISDWRICALTPLDSVPRVKGHLYRYHRIFQCQRCKGVFKSEAALDAHLTAVRGCELSITGTMEGITIAIERQLKSRKKAHPNQTGEQRWKEIYQILFPQEQVPSAFFEPVQDTGGVQSPDSEELANYEEYSRRELPRIFRSALEAAVNNEVQPIEEHLRTHLVEMIQDCQTRVFSSYRSKPTIPNEGTSYLAAPTTPEPLNSSRSPQGHHPSGPLKQHAEEAGNVRTPNMLEGFFLEPPSQYNDLRLDHPAEFWALPCGNNFYPDSAYTGELPAAQASQTPGQWSFGKTLSSQEFSSRTPPSVEIQSLDGDAFDIAPRLFRDEHGKAMQTQELSPNYGNFLAEMASIGQDPLNLGLDNFNWELYGQEEKLQRHWTL